MKICSVSMYPPKGTKHFKMGGVASYTKNLVDSLASQKGSEIIVIANKIKQNEEYKEGNVKVVRCWGKNKSYPFQVFSNIMKNKKDIDIIHIQHEYFLYGGFISALLFPLMLFLLKFSRKPIVVTLHGTIPISQLNDDFARENNIKGNRNLMKFGLFVLTNIISGLSNNLIVHENYQKLILTNDYKCSGEKIIIINHGIETRLDGIEYSKAKHRLGIKNKKVVLFFGYIAGYKGLELLIDSFDYLKKKNYTLVIAGGEHPRLVNDNNYKMYIDGLKERAAKISKGIIFTGFVPEEKIPLYFSAADIVVFPYTVAMAASGSISLAVTYKRQFIVSEALSSAFNKLVIFKKSPKDLANKILSASSYKTFSKKYIESLQSERGWKVVGMLHVKAYEKM